MLVATDLSRERRCEQAPRTRTPKQPSTAHESGANIFHTCIHSAFLKIANSRRRGTVDRGACALMAWGKSTGATELIAKAATSETLVVLPFRAFGDAECDALCRGLEGNCTLTELKASGHTLGHVGLGAVGSLLGSGRCALRRLAIGNSSLGGAGIRAMVVGLGKADCSLHALDLGLKGLGINEGDEEALASLLVRCTDLRELQVGRNPLGTRGLQYLASGCLARPLGGTLLHLELDETTIDGVALGALADTAVEHGALVSVRTLDLSRNPAIGGGPGDQLRRLLCALPSLRNLQLQACNLDGHAAAALGTALLGGPSAARPALVEMSLSDNPLLLAELLANDAAGGEAVVATSASADGQDDVVLLSDTAEGRRPRPLPSCFTESSLPTRVEYERSLFLPLHERLALEASALERNERGGRGGPPVESSGASSAADRDPQAAMRAEGALRLVAGLRVASSLTTLKLGTCGMADCVAAALSAGPAALASLTELDVRSNQLGAIGAAALLSLPSLCSLSLFDNASVFGGGAACGRTTPPAAQGAAGRAAAVAAALANETAPLTSLDLGACGLEEAAGLAMLTRPLEAGGLPSLTCLELFGNGPASSKASSGAAVGEAEGTAWAAAISALRAARPGLDVAWREPTEPAAAEQRP